MADTKKLYYSYLDLERMTGLSRMTLWRRVRDGRLAPPVRLSPGRVGFHWTDVEKFLMRDLD